MIANEQKENAAIAERAPNWRAVAAEQFRTVGSALRAEFRAAAAVLIALSIMIFAFALGKGERTHFYITSYITAPVVLAGLVVAVGIWRDEEPSNRAYFWCMPVDRMRHSLLKVSVGWVWMMAAVTGYLVWAVGITWLTGGNIAQNSAQAAQLVSASEVKSLRVADFTLGEQPWLWLSPFAASTVTYLVGSSIAVASNHSWRWLTGLTIGIVVLAGIEEEVKSVRILETLAFGPHGFLRLCILEAPSAASWVATAGLWLMLALAGTVVVAWRQRER